MAKKRTTAPKKPTVATVKRLFAVSGNRCAFPKCSTPLIDPQSGSVIGEICHIRGDKPKSARFDPDQKAEARQGFGNLILLCNVHHKVVDDDEEAYTVEHLTRMKRDYEAHHPEPPAVDAATAKRFVTVAISNSTVQGSVVTSHGQTGGQTAHTITNNYAPQPTVDESVRLEGKLDTAGSLEVLHAFGCPGMRFTVTNRGSRPAKIQKARLLIDGVDLVKGFEQGFGANFGYTPLEGSTQVMTIELIPMTRPNAQEGYVLCQDDVARFYYPLPLPSSTLALRAKPEELTIAVQFFDDSERTVLAGREIKDMLQGIFEFHRKNPGRLKVPIRIGVRLKSTTPPNPEMADLIGQVNREFVPVVSPDELPKEQR